MRQLNVGELIRGDGWSPEWGPSAKTRIQGPIYMNKASTMTDLNVVGDVYMDSHAIGDALTNVCLQRVCIEGNLILKGPQEKGPQMWMVRVAGGRIVKPYAPMTGGDGRQHDYMDKAEWNDVRVKDYSGSEPAIDLDVQYAQGGYMRNCGTEFVGGLAMRLRGEWRGGYTIDEHYDEANCRTIGHQRAGIVIEPRQDGLRTPVNGIFIRAGHLSWGAVNTDYAVETRGIAASAVRFPIPPLTGGIPLVIRT